MADRWLSAGSGLMEEMTVVRAGMKVERGAIELVWCAYRRRLSSGVLTMAVPVSVWSWVWVCPSVHLSVCLECNVKEYLQSAYAPSREPDAHFYKTAIGRSAKVCRITKETKWNSANYISRYSATLQSRSFASTQHTQLAHSLSVCPLVHPSVHLSVDII